MTTTDPEDQNVIDVVSALWQTHNGQGNSHTNALLIEVLRERPAAFRDALRAVVAEAENNG